MVEWPVDFRAILALNINDLVLYKLKRWSLIVITFTRVTADLENLVEIMVSGFKSAWQPLTTTTKKRFLPRISPYHSFQYHVLSIFEGLNYTLYICYSDMRISELFFDWNNNDLALHGLQAMITHSNHIFKSYYRSYWSDCGSFVDFFYYVWWKIGGKVRVWTHSLRFELPQWPLKHSKWL